MTRVDAILLAQHLKARGISTAGIRAVLAAEGCGRPLIDEVLALVADIEPQRRSLGTELLLSCLGDDGTALAAPALERAAAAGLHESTVRRARKRMGVRAWRERVHARRRADRSWRWRWGLRAPTT